MRWKKLGLVYGPDGSRAWAKTHAAVPTPYLLDAKTIRVIVTGYDSEGRGRPGYVDLDAENPTRVLAASKEPLLDIGQAGCFDDNGLTATCIVPAEGGETHLYYAGFELCTKVRYRILTGLAISRDGGRSFQRHSRMAALERSEREPYFRCGAFVARDEGSYKMWYVAGDAWTQVGGKEVPVYDLRTLVSADGRAWPSAGSPSMALQGDDEHGFGRPWVLKRGPQDYQLFYSIRRRSVGAYRLGYAESVDGQRWQRKDAELGLDVSPGSFDGQAIMYSAVLQAAGQTYCFYNGDNFGEHGFAVAVLQP